MFERYVNFDFYKIDSFFSNRQRIVREMCRIFIF